MVPYSSASWGQEFSKGEKCKQPPLSLSSWRIATELPYLITARNDGKFVTNLIVMRRFFEANGPRFWIIGFEKALKRKKMHKFGLLLATKARFHFWEVKRFLALKYFRGLFFPVLSFSSFLSSMNLQRSFHYLPGRSFQNKGRKKILDWFCKGGSMPCSNLYLLGQRPRYIDSFGKHFTLKVIFSTN